MSIMRKKHFGLTLGAALIAGAVGEFGLVSHAGAGTGAASSSGAFEMVEMQIEGMVYEVQVRRDSPVIAPSRTAHFY